MVEVAELVAKINADPSGFKKGLKDAGVTLSKESKNMLRDVSKVEKGFLGLSTSAKDFAKLALGGMGLTTLTRDMARSAKEIQSLNARMQALTGSASKANEAMSFLNRTAQEQSVDLLDLADGYTRLLPAVQSGIISMEEMRNVLRLANDNASAFGLTTSEVQGLFLGLSQALSSGTVTMEDLRQVTDRLPSSLNLMAESVGMSVGEFKNLVATGKVTAEQIMPALEYAFKKQEGVAQKLAGTIQASTVRMKNAWRDMLSAIAETGIIDVATGAIEQFTNSMNFLIATTLRARIAFNSLTGDNEELIKLTRLYDHALQKLDKSAKKVTKSTGELSNENEELADRLKTAEDSLGKLEGTSDKASRRLERDFDRVTDAIAGAILGTEDLGDSLKNIGTSMLSSAISGQLQNVTGGLFESIGLGGSGGSGGGAGSLVSSGIGKLLTAPATSLLTSVGLVGEGAMLGVAGGMGATIGAGVLTAGVGLVLAPLIAGLFSGGTPHPASTFGGSIGADGLGNVNVLSKHLDDAFGDTTSKAVGNLIAQMMASGINVSGFNVHGGTDVGRGGGFFSIGDPSNIVSSFDEESEEDFYRALDEFAQELAEASGYTGDYKEAIEANAENLMRTNEAQAELQALQQQEIEIRQTLIRESERLASTFSAVSLDMMRTADQLLTSDLSPLSPMERLNEARSQFNTLLASALGGDTNSAGQLKTSATAFLNASRDFNASGTAFTQDFNAVQSGLRSVGSVFSDKAQASTANARKIAEQSASSEAPITNDGTDVSSLQGGLEAIQGAITSLTGKITTLQKEASANSYTR